MSAASAGALRAARGRAIKIKPMTPGVPHSARMRAYLAGVVVTLGLVGVAWRAWALQVEDADRYRALAARQHAQNVDIPAPRGEVIDAHGRPLAVTADADSVWANPREIRDVTETAAKLAALLEANAPATRTKPPLSAQTLESKLGLDRRFVWIDRHVSAELAAAVRTAKLPGIYVAREPRRWYPGRAIGGPVIGRADIDGNGLDGIELSMNRHLTGRRGGASAVRDARGRKMFADGLAHPEPGATVRLTLDRSIQEIADRALADAVTTHAAKSGVVVVLEVATSNVLAMSSYPTYDSNTGHGIKEGARNRPVTDVFEAGSVMKLFTVAAALDEGVVRPDSWFDVHSITIGHKTFRDVKQDKYLTTTGIIKRSSNVGTVQIGMRLGRDKLHAALRRFGFGEKTQIELPGEQAGSMRAPGTWRDIELATISFGYGVTVSTVQIAAALAALGNDGMYRAPRILESIESADGSVVRPARPEPRRAITSKTAAQLRKMMETVFEGGKDGGTASTIVVPGFKCGGKTGTAHKWDSAARMYAPKRYLSSFIGLAPIEQPRLAIVVLLDEPSGVDYYGGKVAGPVFAQVASESLRYLGVPGESLICPPVKAITNPWAVIAPRTCTTPAPRPPRAEPHVAASEPAIATEAPDAIELVTWGMPVPPPAPDGPTIEVPDFRGMSLRRALDIAREQRLPVDIVGSGRVSEQDPAPGSAPAGARITLRFSDGDSRTARDIPPGP